MALDSQSERLACTTQTEESLSSKEEKRQVKNEIRYLATQKKFKGMSETTMGLMDQGMVSTDQIEEPLFLNVEVGPDKIKNTTRLSTNDGTQYPQQKPIQSATLANTRGMKEQSPTKRWKIRARTKESTNNIAAQDAKKVKRSRAEPEEMELEPEPKRLCTTESHITGMTEVGNTHIQTSLQDE